MALYFLGLFLEDIEQVLIQPLEESFKFVFIGYIFLVIRIHERKTRTGSLLSQIGGRQKSSHLGEYK